MSFKRNLIISALKCTKNSLKVIKTAKNELVPKYYPNQLRYF
ncbi:hypothetical protein HMPREF0766_14306 [Sphingobacterium spiritivorum ATCC 33861]|uniref:Uncharacterized protein n=1 Tax=Sphingobacterium spiritivorum ATCC 33861 TaxID=525373 RepID=D7VTK2_SPHSI|nr:hypothetical protein HMPREF0766_14306 [Sphingobacterium spiritivorum ATCC 33861]